MKKWNKLSQKEQIQFLDRRGGAVRSLAGSVVVGRGYRAAPAARLIDLAWWGRTDPVMRGFLVREARGARRSRFVEEPTVREAVRIAKILWRREDEADEGAAEAKRTNERVEARQQEIMLANPGMLAQKAGSMAWGDVVLRKK